VALTRELNMIQAFVLGYTICLSLAIDNGLGLKDSDLSISEVEALAQVRLGLYQMADGN
jgi:hypothetical protein